MRPGSNKLSLYPIRVGVENRVKDIAGEAGAWALTPVAIASAKNACKDGAITASTGCHR